MSRKSTMRLRNNVNYGVNVEEEPSTSMVPNRSIPVNPKETARNSKVVDIDQRSSVYYSVLIATACATLIFLSLLFWLLYPFSPSNPDGHDGLHPSMETGFVSSKPDVQKKVEHFLVDMQQKHDHFLEKINHSVHLDIQDMKARVDEVNSNRRLEASAVEELFTDYLGQLKSESAGLKLLLKIIAKVSEDLLSPKVADRMTDFALESKGGSVISTRCSETYNSASMTFFGYRLWCVPERPATVIQGYTVLRPGKCWAFSGTQGTLLISLSQPVSITHVTLDHLPSNKSPTGHIYSAPKHFQVFGMNNENEEGTLLGSFTYDKNGEPTQTFELPHPSNVHQIVELRVLTNWGQKDYTCLYRFRVHGKEV